MTEYLTTPTGRFVMGDAFNGSDKDHQGRLRIDKNGQPKMQWFVAIAIPKNDPEWANLWQQITSIGTTAFPGGEAQRPDFSWKVVDGDVKYPDRPECAGCYILRMSTGFAPTVWNTANPPAQIVDPAQCKRGYYIRAQISVAGNGDTMKPGVYVNMHMIQVVGYGEEIVSGPSAAEVFAAPAALPPGASTTPVAPATPMPAAAPVPTPAPVAQPAAPVPPTNPAPVPTAPAGVAPAAPVGAPVPGTASSGEQVQPYPQILTPPVG